MEQQPKKSFVLYFDMLDSVRRLSCDQAGHLFLALFEYARAAAEEDWDRVMDTNAKAPFFLSRAVLSHMIERQVRGNILNVVSEAAFVPASASYGASKHALRALTAGMAGAAIRHGVVINGIAPGTTATDFVDIASEIAMNRQPIGRLGTAEEMAELAAFLMSREGENIVGQTILSCGGSTY